MGLLNSFITSYFCEKMARVPDLAEFDFVSLIQIGANFKDDREHTIGWCRQHGLLANNMVCPNCGGQCREQGMARYVDGVAWRCTARRCKRVFSIRRGSFFEKSHLHLWQLLGLTYIWSRSAGSSRGMSVADTMHELEIQSEHTIVDWNQFCRDVCVSYFVNHPTQLGGPGRLVEIDESLFARRKYNQGRIVAEQWIFGGYEAETKQGFLVPVPRRDAATLLPIIQRWIRPGSTIWSDMWQAYNQIGQLGYQHGTVNHNNFVDPATAVTTNRVEAMWQRAKAKFKAMAGPSNRAMIPDYLAEFMWVQRFGDHAYFNFWNQIATDLYVV
ncbi:uncharacterized protein LOC141913025 [Tubulanus polymorphus]|uniref:uncharacterized protein LOC141913025 n=1 Tax=Tubulanus polymorphus TaxID=672921 RepID=UPI003DA2482D